MIVGVGTYGAAAIHVCDWSNGTELYIGNYCSIASNVTVLLGGGHHHDRVTTFPFSVMYQFAPEVHSSSISKGDVRIGHDVWIGQGVTFMPGVTVGSGSIIATNSHVVKDVQPYTIVGGNPAKLIKHRFTPEQTRALLDIAWWDWPLDKIERYAALMMQPDIDLFIKTAQES